jgi:hypothetical protein
MAFSCSKGLKAANFTESFRFSSPFTKRSDVEWLSKAVVAHQKASQFMLFTTSVCRTSCVQGNYLVITDQIWAETIWKDCSLWHRALISSFNAISQRMLWTRSIKQSRTRWPSHERRLKMCLIHLTDNYIELLAFCASFMRSIAPFLALRCSAAFNVQFIIDELQQSLLP